MTLKIFSQSFLVYLFGVRQLRPECQDMSLTSSFKFLANMLILGTRHLWECFRGHWHIIIYCNYGDQKWCVKENLSSSFVWLDAGIYLCGAVPLHGPHWLRRNGTKGRHFWRNFAVNSRKKSAPEIISRNHFWLSMRLIFLFIYVFIFFNSISLMS